jgi:Bacterial cadherin-like domain/Bacterial Ig domain/RTX calcium-binding nonapeptide repeat (4 copies)
VTIAGTAGADSLVGTARGDVIVAGAGDDEVRGRGGADVICNGDGDDLVEGGAGDDEVGGGRGEDRLEGGSGDDWLAGRRGSDVVLGGRGDDRLVGERGDDVLRGNAGDDRLGGGPGDDRCTGGSGIDVLRECETGDAGSDAPGGPGGPDAPRGPGGPGGPGAPPTDQPPVAVGDSTTVDEDSGPNDVPVLANDTDADGGAKSIASATQPTDGTVQITGGGSGLSYEPDPDYCNDPLGSATDDFTYTLAPGGSSASVAMTVTCVNDAPVVAASGGAPAYTEGDPATAVDGGLTVTDPDDTSLEGATARISAGHQSADELLFTDQSGITGTYSAGTGVLTLTGTASLADYQTALQSVQYRHTGDNPAVVKTVEFRADDGDGLGPASTRNIDVTPVDDAPVAVNDSARVNEDVAATAVDVLANDTDVDGGTTIASASDPANGTVVLTGGSSGAHTGLTYEPDPDYCNDPPGTTPDTFTYALNGGSSATVSVTVTCVDDAPAAVADSATVDEDSGANAVDVLANDTDVDAGPMAITSASDPANGTVVLTGGLPGAHTGLTYEPDPDYCNDPPGTADDTFTYTLNGGSTTTVSVTVTCIDDAPVAVDDSATVDEDFGANAIDVLANDDNDDGGPKAITSASDPANGTVVLTGGLPGAHTGLTYQPDPDYCNDPPGTTPDTFTYTLNGGSSATVSVTVSCIDDAPVAVDDSATVDQDSAATAIDVLATDTDIDGGPMAITSASDPANGTVVLTGGLPGAHTGLTYQPDPNYCNDPPGTTPDTFTYALNGGSTATVSVKVTCPDVAPTAVDDSPTVAEDSAATAIDVLANDTDPDGGPMVIESVSDPANGTVVLTGGSPGAHTGLTYQPDPDYCNDPPGTTPDTFTYTLNGGSTATVSVTVTCVDDPPLAVDDSETVAEDADASAITVLANDVDVDGGPKTIASASDPANGTVVLTGGSPGAHTGLTYQPDPNYCNSQPLGTPDTFSYTVNGGSTATVSVTVTCAADNPVVDTSAGTTSYTENAAATVIDAAVTVSDPDAGATITGATVEITGNPAGGEDILALAGTHPGITATLSGVKLTLSGDATAAAYQSALRDVTYRNSSDSPSTAPRTITFTVTDDTALSGSDIKGLTVTAVDDPPTAVNDSATVLEDAAATAVAVLANDTDVDAGPKTISSATDPASGTVVLTGGSPGAHTGLTYQPDPNYCNDPPGTTPDTFNYTVNGGSTATVSMTVTCVNDAPVADDETFDGANGAIGNTTLVVDDPDDGAPNPSHPKKTISGDILAGDTDVDGPGPLTVTAGTFATNDGGSVTIEADGDFTYFPAASTSCTDTSDFFDYTITDQNTPTAGTDTGRVTIQIAGCVWYVSNNAAGDSGTASTPFDTLAQAEAASGANHTVFVFDGDNTSTGYGGDGYAMNAGERLIGEHEGLVVDPDGGGGPLAAQTLHPANPGAHPTLAATSADVVDLDDGNELRGLNIDPSNAGGIAGGTGDTGGGTIDDVNVVNEGTAGTQPGLELSGTTGTFNISNLTVNNSALGVSLVNAGTVNFQSAGTIAITTSGAKGLDAAGTNMGTGTFDSITVTGSANGGVSMINTTGTTTFGDLSLTTTSGTAPAFALSNAGTVSVPAAGTANVSATGGPAVDVTGTSGATLAFDDVDSTNSANDGINLDGLGTGTFSAASTSTITGAAGIAFDLNGGSGDVTFPGTITNGQGSTAEITGRTGGTVTLSGPTTETGDADATQENGGIAVTGNSGGSTVVSNATKTFNTGEDHAIVIGTSDGHTINLTNGGLDIDTTSGGGLSATGSGTITVTTGTNPNTIDSTTGTALNVVSTDIDGSGITFRSISASGGANGIVLNGTGTTGSNGGLTVTGDGTNTTVGGNATGGTIGSMNGADSTTAGIGVYLNSTRDVSLRRMTLNGMKQGYGIRGNGVNNFTLEYSTVSGTNGTAASLPAPENYGEGAIHFGNATANGTTGNVTLTNNIVTGGRARDFSLVNTTAGTTNLTVKGNTFGGMQNFSDGNQCVAVEARVSSGVVINTTFGGTNPGEGNTINNCVSDNANFTGQGNTTMDVAFRGNTLSNNNPNNIIGGGNLVLATKGTMTTHVTNNTMRDANGSAVTLFKASADPGGSTPSLSSFFANNTIGVAGVADSGSKSGNGIFVSAGGTGTMSYTIQNNTIQHIHGNAHIYADNTGGSYTANFTITGNTLGGAQPPNWFAGIAVTNGSPTSNDTVNVCAKIGGSTPAEKNTLNLGGNLGIIVGSSGAASGHPFVLPGLTTSTEAGVESFMQNNNTGSFTSDAYADSPATFGAFTGTGTSCPTPSS